jgi:hypothetical protein
VTPQNDQTSDISDAGARSGSMWSRIQLQATMALELISHKRRYLIFPAAVLIALLVFTALGISGTSSPLLAKDAGSSDTVIVGLPRAIRSDEWIVHTPLVISQVENGMPRYGDVGVGSHDMSVLSDLPVADWTRIFHPNHWAYGILPIDNAYAFDWWSVAAILLLGTYAFLLAVLGSLRWAIVGALLLYGSPFFHWWYTGSAFGSIGLMAFAGACLLLAVTSSGRRLVVFALLGSFFLACFALTIYPPFQIPAGIGVGIVTAGALWPRWREGLATPRSVVISGAIAGGVALVPIGAYLITRAPAMNAISQTVYPGARVVSGGELPWGQLFSSWFGLNFITNGSNLRGVIFENESEGSSFLLLGVMLLVALPLVWRFIVPMGERLRGVIIATTVAMSLFLTHMFVGLPSIVAKLTFLSIVPERRALIGLGFASMVLVVAVGASLERSTVPTLARRLAGVVLVAASAAGVMGLAQDFRAVDAPVGNRMIAVALLAAVSTAALYFWRPLVSVVLLAAFGLLVALPVNPLINGLSQTRDSAVVSTARTIATEPGETGAWVGETYVIASLLTTAGVQNLSGVNLYPNVPAWQLIDPEHEYENVWNRYAQAVWAFDVSSKAPVVRLVQPDMIEVTINPCDPVLDKFNVRHLVTSRRMQGSCLSTPSEVVGPEGVPAYFYERSPVGAPSEEGWTVR